ncbi:hypothetical protein V8C37DRAFT_363891, partial [Trichoderma ceciliae]
MQLAHQHYQLLIKLSTVMARYKDRKPLVNVNLLRRKEMLNSKLLNIIQKTKASVLIISQDIGSIGCLRRPGCWGSSPCSGAAYLSPSPGCSRTINSLCSSAAL